MVHPRNTKRFRTLRSSFRTTFIYCSLGLLSQSFYRALAIQVSQRVKSNYVINIVSIEKFTIRLFDSVKYNPKSTLLFLLCRSNSRQGILIQGMIKGAYWISSNIAIAILNFSLLLPIQLSLFQLCNSKVVALYPFA